MSAQQTFVIVGAGLAGAKAAEALRTNGFDGAVVLIGEEADRPYDRPPLSKDYLQGKSEKDTIYLHPADWYAEHHIDLRLRTRATAVDRAAHRVATDDGQHIGYDKLLLATGSTPRRLPLPGADLTGVQYLRRVGDCEALTAALASAQRVVIIGAGWIGLETAAAARAAGCHVTVIERSQLPLLNVLGPEVAATYAALHRHHGVDLRPGRSVHEIIGDTGKVTGVRLADGSVLAADTVIVGVGITPNTELAEAAGLRVDNGIFVDEHLATADPDVFRRRRRRQQLLPAAGRSSAPRALVGRPAPGGRRGGQHDGPQRFL
jgi:3-phenylpropionate/trans-cinnamate dioxygenase ferredoxin reductase subunit